MAEKWKERIRHAVLALLLSVGLSMALAGSLDETLISPRMLYVIAAAVVVFELASLHRISAWAGVFAAAAGLIFWIFAGNGAQILSDAGIAVSLRMKGIHTAALLLLCPAESYLYSRMYAVYGSSHGCLAYRFHGTAGMAPAGIGGGSDTAVFLPARRHSCIPCAPVGCRTCGACISSFRNYTA